MDIEELDGGVGGGEGAGGDVFLVDEIEEVGTEFVLSDEVGGLAIVASELPHGLDIAALGAVGETTELHVREHALA
ncbi:MAG: hypothetical protein M3380_13385 [Chloroflexota bacterium]|nr:hypothetical protein [Chloroflexota bacterium]